MSFKDFTGQVAADPTSIANLVGEIVGNVSRGTTGPFNAPGGSGGKGPGGGKKAPKTANLQAGTGAWQPCLLTWYDPALGGTNSGTGRADPHAATASGEPYDATKLTCAAPSNYPFGTLITFRVGGHSVTCRVNDRGGAINGSHFDLSRAAADSLRITQAGSANGSFKVGGSSGSAAGAAANNTDTSAPGGSTIGSVLDLLTAPVDTIGGWLAQIALNVVKDIGEGIADYIIRPAWHWNQRAANQYQADMFGDKSGKQLLWTAAFWGGGYWLLFTDPNAKSLTPQPVRNSRLAKHARFAQSLPARHTLVKPKDVKRKTPRKPEPIASRAPVILTGTMSTSRTHRVKVTGNHAGLGSKSETPVKPTGAISSPQRNSQRSKPTVPDKKHGTGTRSLPHRGGSAKRDSAASGGRGNRA